MSEDGYLLVYDAYTESWDRVKDLNGNDVCLIGPKGDPGINGLDGQDGSNGLDATMYHLELSNDMDQIYVGQDRYVETEHFVETSFTLFDGGFAQAIGSDWQVELPDSAKYPWETRVVGSSVQFVFKVGMYIKDTTYIYPITLVKIDQETGKTICRVSKEFKLKRITGTEDYDLKVSSGFIKLLPSGGINPKNSTITVSIKSRSVGSLDSAVTFKQPGDLPSSYLVEYKWDSDSSMSSVPNDGIIDLSNAEISQNSTLLIQLRETSQGVIDSVKVECLKDGIDGTAQHVELSDDFNQIYFQNGEFVGPNLGI
jgi:hypothetical protein